MRLARRLAQVGSTTAVMAVAAVAQPQQGVSVRTRANALQVEAGESFVVQVTALGPSGTGSPTSPRLEVPAGVVAHGPSVSTQQQVSIINGRIEQRQGITASWTLTAAQPGRYRIGPGSVTANGARVLGDSVVVVVVPAGSARARRPGGRPWPFDPFGIPRMPIPGFDFDDGDSLEQLPAVPEELRVEHARDPLAFLNATVDKTRVVVGEQLTFRIVAYGGRGPFRETNTTEPSRGDFLGFSLIENSQGERVYAMEIDGKLWHAAKVRELALFPIRAGKLSLGSMKMGFEGRGYPGSGSAQGLMRQSNPLEIAVVEPPMQGRPAGYKVGDVGQFRLTATVEPRSISAGEAVSVVVSLEGKGNLPYKLRTPEQRGVEWLEPTTTEQIEPQDGVIGGQRKFTYVVRLASAGNIDLGAITLPFWDPEKRAYDTASAALGTVQVVGQAASATDTPAPAPASDALANVLMPRRTLGPPARATRPLTDRGWFWAALLGGPLAVVVAAGSVRIGRSARTRWSTRQTSHSRLAAQALATARAAADGDAAQAATHVERALFVTLEGAHGVRARGLLRRELGPELLRLGFPEGTVVELTTLLDTCDALRFTGDSALAGPQLVARAEGLVRQLERQPRSPRTT